MVTNLSPSIFMLAFRNSNLQGRYWRNIVVDSSIPFACLTNGYTVGNTKPLPQNPAGTVLRFSVTRNLTQDCYSSLNFQVS